jgi:hypothetical protein
MRRRFTQDEDGATLVIVLILISVFGLVVGGLLTESAVSVKYTKVVSSRQANVYAADAGVSAGIQLVRQKNMLCPGPGLTGTIAVSTPPVAKVPAVTVTCTGTLGSALGAGGYAIMVRNSTTGVPGVLNTQSGSGVAKEVEGPVFVEGTLDLQASLHVLKGDLAQQGTCQPGANFQVMDSGYAYYCPATAPALPAHVAPAAVPPADATLSVPTSSTVAGTTCSIFRPGHYIAKPNLQSGNNYFTSGFYYFDFDDEIVAGAGNKVWAGRQSPAETATPPPAMAARPACAVDPGQPADPTVAGPSGWGVVFAFGKTARLRTDGTGSNQGNLEIFARNDPTGASGTNGISIIAVPAPPDWPATWNKSTAGTTLTSVGNNSTLAIHGLVYARDQTVALWANNGVETQVLGGVVANRLELQATGSGHGIGVSVAGDNPDPRYVRIKAVVSVPGGKDVVSTAVIQLDNDLSVLPVIASWRTSGIVDPL